MKAAVCREFGTPLVIEEIEIDPPKAGEVKVALAACAICHSDITYMNGGWGGTLPAVYGHEASGVVENIGPGVTRIAPGDHVLIHGGAGGVGHIAIQLAKAQGARVAATISSAAKADIARRMGADETINYREESVEDYVQRLTSGRGFDVVFDATGGSDIATSFAGARVNGQVATIVSQYEADLTPMHTKSLTLHTIFMLTSMLHGVHPQHHGEILTKAAALATTDQLKPLLDERRFTLGDVAAAHSHLEAGAAVGKIVIDIADEARNA